LRADNHAELGAAGRLLRVAAQVRIEELEAGRGRRIVERVLSPIGQVRSRRLYTRSFHAGGPFPESGWTRLGSDPKQVIVPEVGPSARQLEVAYRAAPEQLGQTLNLWLGGRSVHAEKLMFTTGRLSVAHEPGSHEVALEGLGATGLGFARAAPRAPGPIYNRQRVYELIPNHPLTLRFERRAGEMLSAFLFVASDDAPQQVRLGYRIDRGVAQARVGQILRRMTEFEGRVSGKTGRHGDGYFWEGAQAAAANDTADPLERLRIPMGDDLRIGWHQLELTYLAAKSDKPLWLRAVVAGRATDSANQERP
jgi:hypothetical protein